MSLLRAELGRGVISLYVLDNKNGAHVNRKTIPSLALTTLFLIILGIIFFGVFSIGNDVGEPNLVHLPNHVKSFIPRMVLLPAVVIMTSIFLLFNTYNQKELFIYKLPFIATLGAMSYSVFLWHQPVIAFCRYLSYPNISLFTWGVVFVAVLIISWLSYNLIEKRVTINTRTRVVAIVSFVVINAFALSIYARKGIVRDVPELYITNGKYNDISLIEYNDNVHSLDVDFPESDKINVLVIGNSFARDWVNVIRESEIQEKVNISYINEISENKQKTKARLQKSDFVFIFDWKHNVPEFVWENIRPETDIWGIGTKNFGKHNGVIYKKRKQLGYFTQLMKIDYRYYEWNELLKKEWGDKYVDLLDISTAKDNSVYVFTDDDFFISPDCRHFSKSGALYFAKKINWNLIFNKDRNNEDY